MRRTLAIALLLLSVLPACAKAGSLGSGGDSGVRGQVLAGPQCPVERAESPCPDWPVPDIQIQVREQGAVVATASSDADGRFELSLPAGRYVLHAVLPTAGIEYAQPVDVTVHDGAFAQVNVLIDTGIR